MKIIAFVSFTLVACSLIFGCGGGGGGTVPVSVLPQNAAPQVELEISPDNGIGTSTTVHIAIRVTDAPGDTVEVRVDLDGDAAWDAPYGGTMEFERCFPQEGTYSLRVQARDDKGAESAVSVFQVVVDDPGPGNTIEVSLESWGDGGPVEGYVRIEGPVTLERTGSVVRFAGLPDGTYTRVSDDEDGPDKGSHSRRTEQVSVSGGQAVALTDRLLPHSMGGDSRFGPWYDWSMVNFLRGMPSNPVDGTRVYGLVERTGPDEGGIWTTRILYAFTNAGEALKGRVREEIAAWKSGTGSDQFAEADPGSHNCTVDGTPNVPPQALTAGEDGGITSSVVRLPNNDSGRGIIHSILFYGNLHGRGSVQIQGAAAIATDGYTPALWMADRLLYGSGLTLGELEKHAAE